MYCDTPCMAPLPSSESSWSPADWLVMDMLVPRFCPKLAATSLAAFASIEPGMKMPSCPSLSYTASSTGMMMPSCSTCMIPMPSLSPCMRPSPVTRELRGRTYLPTRIGSKSLNLTLCPLLMVWSPCTQARMVFLVCPSAVFPTAVWNPAYPVCAIRANSTESLTGCGSDDTTGVETCPTGTALAFLPLAAGSVSSRFSVPAPSLPGVYLAASS